MPAQAALKLSELPIGSKKTVTAGETKILLVRVDDQEQHPVIYALEAECPHAKAPLEKGAVCNGRLVCPWHAGTFALETGGLLEPPPLRALKRYAVEIVAGNILVDPAPLPEVLPMPVGAGQHLVFAGGGAATASALVRLEEANFVGKVTVIEPLGDEPVDRTQLTKNALAGKKELDSLGLFPAKADLLGSLQITRETGSLTAVNTAERTVQLSDGRRVGYDALLLATGGRPKHGGIPGADLPNVFTIRHTADLRRMEPYLKAGQHAVLIGDSFIAFEAASALRQRDLATTILARTEAPFAKKFGAEVSEALLALHRRNGVTVHTGTTVAAITHVAVTKQDGSEIPADLVILAVGVEPVTDYLAGVPKDSDGSLPVGRDLRIHPRVWCAGDIAAVDGTRIEHWRLAQQHGRTAATAMLAGIPEQPSREGSSYDGVPLFWTTHFGQRLNYAGHANTWEEIVYDGSVSELNFVAYYMKDGLVAAALGCKQDTPMAALMEPLRKPLTLVQARAAVAKSTAA